MLKPLDLSAIEARALASPAGDWHVGTSETGELLVYIPDTAPLYIGDMAETEGADHDLADFLAGARADVLTLVAYARALAAENARLRAGLIEMRGLSMHSDWCWSESVRVDIDRLLRGETLPGQEP